MEHQSHFVGGGPCARTTHGKADATTPVNGYPVFNRTVTCTTAKLASW